LDSWFTAKPPVTGLPQFSDSAKSGTLLTLAAEILRGRHENMSGLAHRLVPALRIPVIDATGLEGEYDYDLSFAAANQPGAGQQSSHFYRHRTTVGAAAGIPQIGTDGKLTG
jgi:uncharacterized protein (TIGR03435 family)